MGDHFGPDFFLRIPEPGFFLFFTWYVSARIMRTKQKKVYFIKRGYCSDLEMDTRLIKSC